MYKKKYFKQIFGCVMGSPISTVIANLVMQQVEEKAISSSNIRLGWWYRFVDDSHSCLQKKRCYRFSGTPE